MCTGKDILRATSLFTDAELDTDISYSIKGNSFTVSWVTPLGDIQYVSQYEALIELESPSHDDILEIASNRNLYGGKVTLEICDKPHCAYTYQKYFHAIRDVYSTLYGSEAQVTTSAETRLRFTTDGLVVAVEDGGEALPLLTVANFSYDRNCEAHYAQMTLFLAFLRNIKTHRAMFPYSPKNHARVYAAVQHHETVTRSPVTNKEVQPIMKAFNAEQRARRRDMQKLGGVHEPQR